MPPRYHDGAECLPSLTPVASRVTRIRARYAETDQMGVVHHANYLMWMEVARVDYCRVAGFRYRDLEASTVCCWPSRRWIAVT